MSNLLVSPSQQVAQLSYEPGFFLLLGLCNSHCTTATSRREVLNPGSPLESLEESLKILMPRLHPRPITSEFLVVKPRHQYFQTSPYDSNHLRTRQITTGLEAHWHSSDPQLCQQRFAENLVLSHQQMPSDPHPKGNELFHSDLLIPSHKLHSFHYPMPPEHLFDNLL